MTAGTDIDGTRPHCLGSTLCRLDCCARPKLYHVPCRGASWGVERAMRAGFETKQFIKFMCVHFGRIINCDRICIEFRVDEFYRHKFFGCDIKIYWCVLMPRLNESVGDRSSLFNLKKIIHSFIHSFILGSGLPYTLPCLRPGLINQSSNPNAYIAGTMEPYNYGHP